MKFLIKEKMVTYSTLEIEADSVDEAVDLYRKVNNGDLQDTRTYETDYDSCAIVSVTRDGVSIDQRAFHGGSK